MIRRASKRAEYHHGDLRRALLHEAVTILGTAGPAALSLRELARRLGVSYGAPHHHFAEKDDLLAAIAEEGFEEILAGVASRAAGMATPHERLRVACETYLAFAMRERARYSVMFLPQLRDRKRFKALHDTGGQALALLAATFEAAGTPRSRARARAVACWSALHGFAVLVNGGFLVETGAELDRLTSEVISRAVGKDE